MNDFRAPLQEISASLVFPKLATTATKAKSDDQLPAHSRDNLRERTQLPAGKMGNVRWTTMSFRNMHEHGELLVNYLEARKAIFIDQLNWDVPQDDGLEFDQYDTPFCRWIVLHEYGDILGGVRLLPTTAHCGFYTYMLRDAQKGLLEGLPTDVLFFEAPVEQRIWEASRFFITKAVPAARRAQMQYLLFESMSHVAIDHDATHILGIVPAVWARWARRLDVGATPIGAKFSIDGTISQSVLFDASAFVD
ncbi:MAG: N-acyl-L-homoserine lactone synthetase [Rhodobacteraceae bacterium]|nr:N-acyl-L-homoserine lactone synthetase [Paracoccaceae bacterium]